MKRLENIRDFLLGFLTGWAIAGLVGLLLWHLEG
jgi:gas vesicle protein